ncbi:hypothetical protein T4B_11466 [Trichinella pseudospiralis]|uniref:Uncharacterized protein n=1 Tax=Trichinella pseudospiralis TaxID=6337 RepID=A0A0V1E0Q3_TRIPS|nr:hypothetical protein T4A_5997 [Trichinella pseudospiralis]KRZ22384.1 hypothetical protein T4B_11466 [Trichinella pseudospiralis]
MDSFLKYPYIQRAAVVDHGMKVRCHSYWIIGILLPCYAVDQRREVAKVE